MVCALISSLYALTTVPQVQKDLLQFKFFSNQMANISNQI